tara:strand:- start:345 stop:464 length:120 start_codon:yes stop_codon:yes gene_type:complete
LHFDLDSEIKIFVKKYQRENLPLGVAAVYTASLFDFLVS